MSFWSAAILAAGIAGGLMALGDAIYAGLTNLGRHISKTSVVEKTK